MRVRLSYLTSGIPYCAPHNISLQSEMWPSPNQSVCPTWYEECKASSNPTHVQCPTSFLCVSSKDLRFSFLKNTMCETLMQVSYCCFGCQGLFLKRKGLHIIHSREPSTVEALISSIFNSVVAVCSLRMNLKRTHATSTDALEVALHIEKRKNVVRFAAFRISLELKIAVPTTTRQLKRTASSV